MEEPASPFDAIPTLNNSPEVDEYPSFIQEEQKIQKEMGQNNDLEVLDFDQAEESKHSELDELSMIQDEDGDTNIRRTNGSNTRKSNVRSKKTIVEESPRLHSRIDDHNEFN